MIDEPARFKYTAQGSLQRAAYDVLCAVGATLASVRLVRFQ